jgi:hypothetical protein
MPGSYTFQSAGAIAVVALLVLTLVYLQPKLFKSEGFQATVSAASNYSAEAGQNSAPGAQRAAAVQQNPNNAGGDMSSTEGAGPAQFGNAESPAGCYPRDQLTPSELLPKDGNSVWAQQNPMGTGSLKGKNFLSAGALIGVNTVGQSLRNANYQLRSEPANPQVPISVFNNSTIEPDVNRRSFEVA